MKKIIIFIYGLLLMLLIVWGASMTDSGKTLGFQVEIQSHDESNCISLWHKGENDYYLFLPSYVELQDAIVRLEDSTDVQIGDMVLRDGAAFPMCKVNQTYPLRFTKGNKTYEGTLTLSQAENVAVLYITTESATMENIHENKKNKEAGTALLYEATGEINYSGSLEWISGRGNSTWSYIGKKPYTIKLTAEEDLLGMGVAQKWILLANAMDWTNVKNKVVFGVADELGMHYTPDTEWVDLYLNGEYVGLYLLSEKIEVHKNRVDIARLNSTLVSREVMTRLKSEETPYFVTDANECLRIRYPNPVTEEGLFRISNLLQSAENAILSSQGVDRTTGKTLGELIDMESWAMQYLLEEVFGNMDAGVCSQYYYIDGNDANAQIYAGPIWDFDMSMQGSWQTESPNAWCANRLELDSERKTTWFYYLCKNEEFVQLVTQIFEQRLKPVLEHYIKNEIPQYFAKIECSADMDAIRWATCDERSDLVSALPQYLTERIAFLNDVWVNRTEYVRVLAYSQTGAHYAHYAIKKGANLINIPELEDLPEQEFLGWYYVDNNQPIDRNELVEDDLAIYSKWSGVSQTAQRRGMLLAPLAIIALLGVALLVANIFRVKE